MVERYRYDAYGRVKITDNAGVLRANSVYGNRTGFTGRYLDLETRMWYFRARYFDGRFGRFLGRDAFDYINGNNLYAAYFSPNYTDPSGYLLIAVDGTGSRLFLEGYEWDNWKWSWSWRGWVWEPTLEKIENYKKPVDENGKLQSHTRNFYEDYQQQVANADLSKCDKSAAIKRYWHGPNSTIIGAAGENHAIHASILNFLKIEFCKCPCYPIDFVGHSRGGYIVNEVAKEILNTGINCSGKIIRPTLRYLGMYDPVDMALGYGNGEDTAKVVHSAGVYAAWGRIGQVTPSGRGHTYVLPPANDATGEIGPMWGERSRASFNRAPENPVAKKWLFATHSGLGGAPWAGDHPTGHTEANDKAMSKIADKFIRDEAKNAGVVLK